MSDVINFNKISQPQGLTIFLVVRQDQSSGQIFKFTDGGDTNRKFMISGLREPIFAAYHNSPLNGDSQGLAVPADIYPNTNLSLDGNSYIVNPYGEKGAILAFSLNKDKTSYRVNGGIYLQNTTSVSFDTTFSGTDRIRLGEWVSDTYIGEVIIFRKGLRNSEIKTIERYLGQKWGIAVNPQ